MINPKKPAEQPKQEKNQMLFSMPIKLRHAISIQFLKERSHAGMVLNKKKIEMLIQNQSKNLRTSLNLQGKIKKASGPCARCSSVNLVFGIF
jgi:hypothetical protein